MLSHIPDHASRSHWNKAAYLHTFKVEVIPYLGYCSNKPKQEVKLAESHCLWFHRVGGGIWWWGGGGGKIALNARSSFTAVSCILFQLIRRHSHPAMIMLGKSQYTDQTRRMFRMSRVFARWKLKKVCFAMSKKVLWSHYIKETEKSNSVAIIPRKATRGQETLSKWLV